MSPLTCCPLKVDTNWAGKIGNRRSSRETRRLEPVESGSVPQRFIQSRLTHKTLELAVPQRSRPDAVGHESEESFLHLKTQGPVTFPPLRHPMLHEGSETHLQGCVKYDQFGAGGDGVVAAVSLHEVHVCECVMVGVTRAQKIPPSV